MPLTCHRLLPHFTLLAGMLAGLGGSVDAAPRPAPAAAVVSDDPDEPMLAYTVTSHDTLIGLNRTLFSSPSVWKEISRINHLADPNKIATGQVLRVPTRLLHTKVVPARLVSVFGDVRIDAKPATAGALVRVGDSIRTGDSSIAVVELADGSRVKLAADTEGRLDDHRRFQIKATAAAIDDGLVAASLRLLSGSIEVLASKVLRARPLEVSTPTAVIGVRGTRYRVRNDVTPATPAASAVNASATEVLEGKVHVQVGSSSSESVDVPANFGAPLEAGKKPVVLPLPAAPDLSANPEHFDRLPLRLHIADAMASRVQIADDAAFDHILVDLHVAAGDDARIPTLGDGTWHLRVRRISQAGLEGLDAVREFALQARPESPWLIEPAAGEKRPVGDVPLRWTKDPDAASYVVDVARDPAFAQIAFHADHVQTEQVVFHPVGNAWGAADGVYFWRVVSVGTSGRSGVRGESQAFVLRPAPRAPMGHVSPDGSAIELRWGGRPEDREEVEMARDPGDREILARGVFSAPAARLPLPRPGTVYAHVRYIEPDGFTTAWSDDVKIDVAPGWRSVFPGSWVK
jgi:hypothetical protein